MVAHGFGEDGALEVASFADEVAHGVAVPDAGGLLLDDGALVEILGDVVRGGADEFDASGVGLVVGACAGEGGEEGVVDVDGSALPARDEPGGDDLHVAGEDGAVAVVLGEEGVYSALCFCFVVFGDWDVHERDARALGGGFEGFVVGDDDGDLGVDLARGAAVDEVCEAVAFFGDEYAEALGAGAPVHGPCHGEFFCDLRERGVEGVACHVGGGRVDLEAHVEGAFIGVGVLVGVEDIDAAVGEKSGDARDDAGLVRACGQEDRAGVFAHRGLWRGLLDGDALCEVARFVYIVASEHGGVARHQLQRDDGEEG